MNRISFDVFSVWVWLSLVPWVCVVAKGRVTLRVMMLVFALCVCVRSLLAELELIQISGAVRLVSEVR